MNEDLLLIGAGGLAREVLEITRLLQGTTVSGILDDNETLIGTSISGVPVLGKIAEIDKFPNCRVLICVANSKNFVSSVIFYYDNSSLRENHSSRNVN